MTVATRLVAICALTLGLGLAAQAVDAHDTPRNGASEPTVPAPAAGDKSDEQIKIEKAVAARKERCRLHPGTCKRGTGVPRESTSKPADRD
ncbi:MAG: hypothetical protein M3O26_18475 [Pseudomonadota bacterium]|nr:hypothetical protein [Pseudomonadota bacterium]